MGRRTVGNWRQAAKYLSRACPVSVLAEPDPLPGAQVQLPVRDRDREVGAQEAGLDVGRLK